MTPPPLLGKYVSFFWVKVIVYFFDPLEYGQIQGPICKQICNEILEIENEPPHPSPFGASLKFIHFGGQRRPLQ